jgi:nucleoside-diphosphate-sugar epimerase
MKKQRILILGATGQIGKSLFDAFSNDERVEVRGTSRMKLMDKNMILFDPFTANWKNLGSFDVLINCIGQITENWGNSFEKIHIGTTKEILKNRSLIGNPKIIQVSALGAIENHNVKFLRTKGIADHILLQNENTVVVRPSIICTPSTMLVKKFRMLKKLIKIFNDNLFVPEGFLESKLQPVLIGDLVDVILNISREQVAEGIVNVVGPEELAFMNLLKIATEDSSNLKIRQLNSIFVTPFVKFLISPLFPNLISFEQYQLLFSDNISNSETTEKILGRKPGSTLEFWKKELQ